MKKKQHKDKYKNLFIYIIKINLYKFYEDINPIMEFQGIKSNQDYNDGGKNFSTVYDYNTFYSKNLSSNLRQM